MANSLWLPLEETWPKNFLRISSTIFLLVLSFAHEAAFAHHEGTVEARATGTINIISGETLPKGKVITSLRYDRREFDAIPDDQLAFLTLQGEDVHAHKREVTYRLSASYGVTDNFTLSFSLPWVAFDQFREATLEDSEIKYIKGDSDGIGDLLLQGKYMFLHTHPDHLSFFAGVKLPTGDTHEKAKGKERFGTHNQPGSGSVDARLGLAWSRIYKRWGIDADLIYEVRTEGAQDFESGNAVLLNLGLSYVTEWLRPRITFVGELNAAHQDRDKEKGERLQHSGVTIIYLSPGIRVEVNRRTNLWLTGSLPLFQHLPGEQAYEKWRMGAGINISW